MDFLTFTRSLSRKRSYQDEDFWPVITFMLHIGWSFVKIGEIAELKHSVFDIMFVNHLVLHLCISSSVFRDYFQVFRLVEEWIFKDPWAYISLLFVEDKNDAGTSMDTEGCYLLKTMLNRVVVVVKCICSLEVFVNIETNVSQSYKTWLTSWQTFLNIIYLKAVSVLFFRAWLVIVDLSWTSRIMNGALNNFPAKGGLLSVNSSSPVPHNISLFSISIVVLCVSVVFWIHIASKRLK